MSDLFTASQSYYSNTALDKFNTLLMMSLNENIQKYLTFTPIVRINCNRYLPINLGLAVIIASY